MNKILVTGGCGFVGSHLVDKLVKMGYHVLVIDDLSAGKKEYCNSHAEYIFGDFKDVLSSAAAASVIKDKMGANIDIIFHLAAQARIQPSFECAAYTYENNSFGTMTVCEYARKNKCKVVYAGSSSFYGGTYLNPYTFSKWQGEEICKMYSKVFEVPTVIARFFNVYGTRNPLIGQYTPVIGLFEQQTINGEPLTIVGDGEQRRDFTHVDDICRGLIALSKEKWVGDVFNLGTGTNYSIKEVADLFGGQKKYLPSRTGESQETLADISKTMEKTNWNPQVRLTDYIKMFLDENKRRIK